MKVLAALLLFASFVQADDGFAKWWAEFKVHVVKEDAKAVARGAKFPLNWELLKIRKLNSEADLIAHFETYFPPDMRLAVSRQRPVSIPGNQYMITWKARGNEYSLHLQSTNGTWAIYALAEGPP